MSKKIIFSLAVIFIALSVTACAIKKPISNQESLPALSDTNSNSNSADDLESSVPATAETTKLDNQVVTPAPVDSTTMKTPDQQENLVAQYSGAVIKTNYGDITVKFYGVDSPKTVNNFLNLAQASFYNGVKFHRVIKNFMIQGGDPLTKGTDTSVYGTGGPGYQFADEFNDHKLVAGSLAMANSGANTNGSQFFVVTAPETPWLDGRHTNFGEVTKGLDVVKKIEAVETVAPGVYDRPAKDVIINSIELLK